MKKIFIITVCILLSKSLLAQLQPQPIVKEYKIQPSQCIMPGERKLIEKRIKQNIEQLKASHQWLFAIGAPSAPLKFSWPLKASSNFTDSAFASEVNYVDHDLTSGLSDWNCGIRTYDGHSGTDIALWPFPWYMMDNKMVKIIAAADGVIVDKHDGEYDRNCSTQGQAANYIVLQHADGTQSWYYHCKQGSVTSKAIGASVTRGELLGYVGSSGNSTTPHLHFEVHDSTGALVDPYKGSCNTINKSLWKNQPVYWGRIVHKIMVTNTPTVYPDCPNPEQINEYPNITKGSFGYFYVFLSQVKMGDTLFLKILKPNGHTWQNWNYVYPNDYVFAYFYWLYNISTNLPAGTWKWQVTLNRKTTSYDFTVSASSPRNTITNNQPVIKQAGNTSNIVIFPNPAKNAVQVKINGEADNYEMVLTDITGKILLHKNVNIADSKNIISLNISAITAGVYQLKVYNNRSNFHTELIIQ